MRRGFGNLSRSTPHLQNATQAPSASQLKAAAADTKRQQSKQLPRSVRWRLSLGLLTRPATDPETNEKEALLKSIEDLNALKLRCQRSRYDELEKKHYWKSTPTVIADETNANGSSFNSGSEHTEGGGLHHVAPGDDPLSGALIEESNKTNAPEKTEGRDRKLFKSFLGGDKTKRSNSLLSESFTSMGSNASNEDDQACKGSRWADFYSTREVLDVIEKDLVRLPNNHYTIFHEWRIKKKSLKEHDPVYAMQQVQRDNGNGMDESNHSFSSNSSGRSGNKLAQSQVVQQGTSARQTWKLGQSINFGLLKGAKSVENFSSLLEDDMDDEDEEEKRNETSKAEVEASIKERAGRISQILFVYAREHPEMGYRQGMHEILSNVLLALEMDLLEQTITMERTRWTRDSLCFGLPKKGGGEGEGGVAGVDSSGNLVVIRLLDEEYILHDAFTLFEYIMTSLAPAYDAIPAGDEMAASMLEEANEERGESPMESMTNSILSKIRFVARDEQLFGHILYMPVPPQLYFAKWIRLMFGRELAGGMKNVLRLWDAFFDLAAARVSPDDGVPITMALLDVLKTAAASMILLIRHKLLAPTMAPNGTMSGEPDPNIGIGYLMNYPPLEDIGELVVTISKMLKREQKFYSQAERKRSQNSLHNFKISSITEHPLEMNERTNQAWHHPLQADSGSSQLVGGTDGYGEQNEFLVNIDPEPPKQDIGESLGSIAEGLLNLGSKTATALIVNIQDKFEHPLQSNGSNKDQDYVIKYRPARKNSMDGDMRSPSGERVQFSFDGDNPRDKDEVEELLSVDEGNDSESESNGGLDESTIASKLSVSKGLRDSMRKSQKELADQLERSVSILMKHFDERMSTEANDALGDSAHSINNNNRSCNIVPDRIWNAMAEIDSVRKELLLQAAMTTYDHGRSCSSLRSSANSGKLRQGSWQL